MKDTQDDDLFKPLSAKVGRKAFVAGGKERKAQRGGDGRKWQCFVLRRKKDQAQARAKEAAE